MRIGYIRVTLPHYPPPLTTTSSGKSCAQYISRRIQSTLAYMYVYNFNYSLATACSAMTNNNYSHCRFFGLRYLAYTRGLYALPMFSLFFFCYLLLVVDLWFTRPIFTKFSEFVDTLVGIINMTFVLRSLKGRCYGRPNQLSFFFGGGQRMNIAWYYIHSVRWRFTIIWKIAI